MQKTCLLAHMSGVVPKQLPKRYVDRQLTSRFVCYSQEYINNNSNNNDNDNDNDNEQYLVLFFLGGKGIHYTIVTTATSRAYDVHCKPKGSSPHHNLNQWMKHTRESTAHIRACHRACQNGN